jgi:hypothetical protein
MTPIAEIALLPTVAACHAWRAAQPDNTMTSAAYAALLARLEELRNHG